MRVTFNKIHLALELDVFLTLFSHYPKHIVLDAWNEANPKIKVSKKK